MPLAKAKSFSRLLGQDRTVIITVLAKPVGASERELRWLTKKAIQAEFSTIEIKLSDGTFLGTLDAPQRKNKGA